MHPWPVAGNPAAYGSANSDAPWLNAATYPRSNPSRYAAPRVGQRTAAIPAKALSPPL